MNIQLAFIFGMLTVVAVIMVITTIIGLVKITKQKKQINNLELVLQQFMDRVHRSTALDDLSREINDRIDDVLDKEEKDTQEIYRQLDSRLDKLETKLKTYVDNNATMMKVALETHKITSK